MSHSSLRVEKDLTHSYLYLYGKLWKEDSHEQKIIQQCSIPGTLPFRLIQEEQEDIFQYNFSPYERMLDYFSDKKMNLSHILSLFESIRFALFHLEEFLLSHIGKRPLLFVSHEDPILWKNDGGLKL